MKKKNKENKLDQEMEIMELDTVEGKFPIQIVQIDSDKTSNESNK